MLKVDLGCAGCKPEGFIGVDRFPFDGVDLVADLDERLPFDSDTVDLVYASHSLEHVRDLMATMREVYRICKHGAQICIVAPYNEQKLNLANPYHICIFNEHTPRFWTDFPDAGIDSEEYVHPHAQYWGLSRSDHSEPGLDLRLTRMEFFYFPEYRDLSLDRQRALRRERLDVCDQIMYHLIVWKGDEQSPGRSYVDHVSAFEPFEPQFVQHRKAQEREKTLQRIFHDRDQAREKIVELQSKLANVSTSTKRITELETDLERAERRLAEARSENQLITTDQNQLRSQLVDLQGKLGQKESLLAEFSNNTRRALELEKDLDRSERYVADIRYENHQLRMQLTGAFEKIEVLTDQLHATKTVLAKSDIESTILNETVSGLRHDNCVLKDQSVTLSGEYQRLHSELARVHSEGLDRVNIIDSLMQESQSLRVQLENVEVIKARTSLLKAELEASNGLLAWYQSQEISWSTESSLLKEKIEASSAREIFYDAEFARVRGELAEVHQLRSSLEQGKKLVFELYKQVSAYRSAAVTFFRTVG